MPSDDLSSLVDAARQGSVQAFCDLVLATQEGVRTQVARLGVRGAAVDTIAQDVFVTAWRRFERFEPGGDFQAWVRGIARNLVRRHFTAAGNTREIDLAAALDSPSGVPVAATPVDLLRNCLEKLGARAREIVRLRYYEESNATEIGSALGLDAAAVRMALQRARIALRDCVEGRLSHESRP